MDTAAAAAAAADVEMDTLQSISAAGSDEEQEADLDQTGVALNDALMSKPAAVNAKDPNRPRRKKARRACFACQRAHLTCGDERPCQRCIKRGLADACQDGVRKKAKYLHDAPNEALAPGAADHFSHGELRSSSLPQHDRNAASQVFPTPNFNIFNTSMSNMLPPTINEQSASFASQRSGPTFGAQQFLHSPTTNRHMSTTTTSVPTMAWHDTLFGGEDPSLLNFDVASMNFGNHYGALEFGMLDKMANGALYLSESDQSQRGSITQFNVPFGSISESPQLGFGDVNLLDSTNQHGSYNQRRRLHSGPPAFAIETTQHFQSPDGQPLGSPDVPKHPESPLMNLNIQPERDQTQSTGQNFQGLSYPAVRAELGNSNNGHPPISTPQLNDRTHLPQLSSRKRTRNSSQIYTNVTTPHPYTANFHHLITYLQGRFGRSAPQTLAIARSLASIRPSFIATTKTLNTDDLVFMEKCFQRTLLEYENFIDGVGTPTIVARRTGEIAAVGKEFQILTGWKKSILLGREANLNVNTGRFGEPRPPLTDKSTGNNTPSLHRPHTDANDGKEILPSNSRPVFLAELLDDDSVVEFYEGFSRLAFGDSRGSVMSRCKLLKYRTREDEAAAALRREVAKREDQENSLPAMEKDGHLRPPPRRTVSEATGRRGFAGERSMQKLGDNDGRVDSAYCWTVKRDVFDIPMMIVMNVSTALDIESFG